MKTKVEFILLITLIASYFIEGFCRIEPMFRFYFDIIISILLITNMLVRAVKQKGKRKVYSVIMNLIVLTFVLFSAFRLVREFGFKLRYIVNFERKTTEDCLVKYLQEVELPEQRDLIITELPTCIDEISRKIEANCVSYSVYKGKQYLLFHFDRYTISNRFSLKSPSNKVVREKVKYFYSPRKKRIFRSAN